MSNNFAFSLNELDNTQNSDSKGCISVINLTNLQRIKNPFTMFYNENNQNTTFCLSDDLTGTHNDTNTKLVIKSFGNDNTTKALKIIDSDDNDLLSVDSLGVLKIENQLIVNTFSVSGSLSSASAEESINPQSGAFVLQGGLGVAKSINLGNNLAIMGKSDTITEIFKNIHLQNTSLAGDPIEYYTDTMMDSPIPFANKLIPLENKVYGFNAFINIPDKYNNIDYNDFSNLLDGDYSTEFYTSQIFKGLGNVNFNTRATTTNKQLLLIPLNNILGITLSSNDMFRFVVDISKINNAPSIFRIYGILDGSKIGSGTLWTDIPKIYDSSDNLLTNKIEMLYEVNETIPVKSNNYFDFNSNYKAYSDKFNTNFNTKLYKWILFEITNVTNNNEDYIHLSDISITNNSNLYNFDVYANNISSINNLFDNDINTSWQAAGVTPQTIIFNFGLPITINKYSINSASAANFNTNSIKAWNLTGSNDNITWSNNIDLVNDLTTTDWSNGSNIIERTINNNIKYKYYKITITECISNNVSPESTGIKFYYYPHVTHFDVTSDGIINTENTTNALADGTASIKTKGGLYVTKDLWVGSNVNIKGNISVLGDVSKMNVTEFMTDDPLIVLGLNQSSSSDTNLSGFLARHGENNEFKFTGLVRGQDVNNTFSLMENIDDNTANELKENLDASQFTDINYLAKLNTGQQHIYDTTESDDINTGAVIIEGGLAVKKKIYVNNLTVLNDLDVHGTRNITNTDVVQIEDPVYTLGATTIYVDGDVTNNTAITIVNENSKINIGDIVIGSGITNNTTTVSSINGKNLVISDPITITNGTLLSFISTTDNKDRGIEFIYNLFDNILDVDETNRTYIGTSINTTSQLSNNTQNGWTYSNNNFLPFQNGVYYLELDLGSIKSIKGVLVRGKTISSGPQYVKKFEVQYSSDGTLFIYALNNNDGTVFTGINNLNVDVNTEVFFKNNYNARYVRIYPLEDTVNNKHTGLSVAVLEETNSSYAKTGFIGYDNNLKLFTHKPDIINNNEIFSGDIGDSLFKTLYFYDKGNEYISGDGTNLSLYSGNDFTVKTTGNIINQYNDNKTFTIKNAANNLSIVLDDTTNSSETVTFTNGTGTTDNAIKLLSTLGGINMTTANSIISLETDGNIINQYQNNKTYTIKNTANNLNILLDDTTNSNETITITNATGITDDAIKLETTLGGINLTTANSLISLETDGDIVNQYQNNKTYTIKNTANNVNMIFDDTINSNETITITNATGTGDNAIKLETTIGGIEIDSAGKNNIDSAYNGFDANVIKSSHNNGGMDLITGTGGIDIITTGLINFDVTQEITMDSNSYINITAVSSSEFKTTTGDFTINSNAANLILKGETGVSIDSATKIDIGTIQDKPINIDASTLYIDSSDNTNITLTANNDNNKILTIAGSNIGNGLCNIDIDTDGILELDAGTGINIGTNANVPIDFNTSTLDINCSGNFTLDSATNINIGGTTPISTSINTTTLDINSSQNITIDSSSNILIGNTTRVTTDIKTTDFNLNSTDTITLTSLKNSEGAITINSELGGMNIFTTSSSPGEDIDIIANGSSVNIRSTENTSDAVTIESTTGGIDINASNASAGEDIDITATGSSVNIKSTENVPDAITIEATTGGIDIIASNATPGEDIDITAIGSSVNINSTEDVEHSIRIHSSAGLRMLNNNAWLQINKNGSMFNQYADNQTYTIKNTTDDVKMIFDDTTNNEKITITNTTGTDDLAIKLESIAGGINMSASNCSIKLRSDGYIINEYQDNTKYIIQNTTDSLRMEFDDTSISNEIIEIKNQTGQGDNSIKLVCNLGGIKFQSASSYISMDRLGNVINQFADNKNYTIRNTSNNIHMIFNDNVNNNETITLTNTTGVTDNAIKLLSTLGGINMTTANSIISLETDGDIINQYQNNKTYTIKNTADNVKIVLDDTNNSAETIKITNSTGTGNNAIKLITTLGGINMTTANSVVVLRTEGSIIHQYQNNTDYTIRNTADNLSIVLDDTTNSNETITLTNSMSTDDNAIRLLSISGGINLTSANSVISMETDGDILNLYRDYKTYTIRNTSNNVNMIFDDTTNSNETITITNATGITDNAIKLETTLGGVNVITANSLISLETDGDIVNQYQNNKTYTIKNTANNVNMIFDDTTNDDETITITNSTGVSDVAIKLLSTLGGIHMETANSIISLETDGDIVNQYQNNKTYTIKNTANNLNMVFNDTTNDDETITITNSTGVSDVGIKLLSTLGGINMTTANSFISLETDGDIRIDTNSNERLTILSNGNVGINNINPQNKLDVIGRVSATDYIGEWIGDTIHTNKGGTGLTSYTNGQLLIGKTDGTLNKRVLEPGNNINIVNDDGIITISATGNEGAVGEEIYWNSPPFISNNISSSYEKMNIAYQNMDTGFQTYIIPYNVRITKILIIQTEETNESYSVKILSNGNQKSITNITVDANKTKRVDVSTLAGDLILADEKLEIEIIDNNGSGNITGEEVLIILEGHYEGIRVGSMWVKINSDIYYKTGGNVGIGTSTPQSTLHTFGTDGIVLPVGSNTNRPGILAGTNAIKGMIRYNTDSGFEGFDGSSWGGLGGGGGGSISSGPILEVLSSMCDGSTVTVSSGTYTFANITSGQYINATPIDLPGSSISYKPPSGTTKVIYEFQFHADRDSSDRPALIQCRFFIDNDEVVNAKIASGDMNNYYGNLINYKYVITCDENTEDASKGKFTSWLNNKTLKIKIRSYNNDLYDAKVHETYYWEGSVSSQLIIPSLTITAISDNGSGINSYWSQSGNDINYDTGSVILGSSLKIGTQGLDSGPQGDLSSGRRNLFITSTYNNATGPSGWWIGAQNQELTTSNNDLHFEVVYTNGVSNSAGFIQNSNNDTMMNFTGQHRCKYDNYNENKIGLIVKSNGTYTNLDNSNQPTINDSLCNVELTSKDNDKAVFGVISSKEDNSKGRTYSSGNFVSIYKTLDNLERIFINSVGEGSVWVCNINGNFENGDYITTCTVLGYGMRQLSDSLKNYTLGKITQDCDFNNIFNWNISRKINSNGNIDENGEYIAVFVGCSYHCG